MKFAHYDEATMQLLGWYDNELFDTIPVPNIEVSDEVYENSIKNNFNKVSLDGTLSKSDFRTLDIKIADARRRRDIHLKQLDSIVTNPLRWAEIDDISKNECIEYRKHLLDVPQQASFPESIDWGTPPSCSNIVYK